MPNLRRLAQRFRSAGATRSIRATRTRLMRHLSHSAVGRPFFKSGAALDETRLAQSMGIESLTPDALHDAIFGGGGATHFLADPGVAARECKEHFPDAVAATIATADAVCRHEFSFLGHDVSFDGGVDWFWCPETGGSWPFLDVATEKALYGVPNKPGDIKFPWELNRHQYFVTLAKAWHYTGDEKYVRECVSLLTDWIEKNPYPRGQNWLPMMELGVRSIAWLNALWLFKDSEYFRENGLKPMMLGLYQHGHRLHDWMTEDWLTPNNHIIGETAGLFTIATLLPCLRESELWQKKALRVFTREFVDQVSDDGVNREQATGYHRFVLDFLTMVYELGQRNSVTIPEPLIQRYQKMIAYEADILGPDGIAPMLGDCDDGRGIAITESVPFLDFAAAVARGGGHSAFATNEEVVWIGVSKTPKTETSHSADRESTLYRGGGTAVMRTGDASAETMLLFRCGEFGFGGEGGATHSHGDMLAPVIYWKGLPLAVDTGTYTYYGDTEARAYARSAAAHNTFTPRGLDQGNPYPVWDWDHQPATQVDKWNVNDAEVAGQFTCEAGTGYTWTRTIRLESNPLTIEFRDALEGGTPGGEKDWLLHLAPGVDIDIVDASAIRLSRGGAPIAKLDATGFEQAEVREGWHSPSYGQRTSIHVLCLTLTGARSEVRVLISEP